MNPASWWTGAIAGAGAYVALLAVSLVVVTLAVIGAALSGSDESVSLPDNPFISDGDLPSPWAMLFQIAAQLPALAMLGNLGGKIGADLGMFGQFNASLGVSFLPLLITAAAIAAVVIAARLAEKRLPSASRVDRLMQSVVSGVVFSLLLNVMATAAALRIPAGEGIVVNLNAANFGSVAVAFLAAAAASYWGRRKPSAAQTGKRGFTLSLLRDAGMTVSVHAGLFLVVAIPAAFIVLTVKGGFAAALSAPLWAPTLGLMLLGLGHFAAYGTHASAGMGSAGMAESNFGYGMDGSLSEMGLPAWAGWLLVLLALVALTAAATYWYLRRGARKSSGITGWVALPAAFLVFGTLLLWFTGVRASFSMAQGAGGASAGFAWWTPFLLLLWGAAAEAASRYAAPAIAPLLPTALVARIQKSPSLPYPAPVAASPQGGTAAPAAPATHPVGAASADASQANAAEAAPAAVPGAPVTVEHKPLSKKAKRNVIIGAGALGLIAVLAIGGAITVNAVKAANGPDAMVEAYLDALVKGDAARAMEISDPSVANTERVLLTNAIYGKATNRVDGFTIGKTTITDEHAVVAAQLRQNGEKVEASFALTKSNPTWLDDNWSMKENGPGMLSFSSDNSISALMVNGVEVPLDGVSAESGSYYTLPAFPGTYELDLPATSKYLDSAPATAVVSIGRDRSGGTAQLTAETNDAFDNAVQEKVKGHLAACAAKGELEPEGCPFSGYAFSDTRDVTWKVTKEPVLETYERMDGTWSLSTSSSGTAVASFEENNSYTKGEEKWEPETNDSRIYVRGTITLDKDELAVAFED